MNGVDDGGEIVVGIDLGTTNSEIAAHVGGRVSVLGPGEAGMLPSCVGLSPAGELLVGRAARNQQLLYPERTVRSVKRLMGSQTNVTLGERSFTPAEISALILRALADLAQRELGRPVARAVITVPAYFSDAQRQATREAGTLAGLEVLRILNEPTAASLAYGYDGNQPRTVLIYDLGGGTFDVSVVRIEGDVTEVLASHGNNQLGGDDFDKLLADLLADEFQRAHGVDLRRGQPAAWSRLVWAAEGAKRALSAEPYARVREEALLQVAGKPLHLERELSRDEYEGLIGPLVETTLDSVSRALEDARLRPSELDAILLVGGSTRTPLVMRVLEERTGLVPRREVHPDLCVALGAGVLASRLGGHQVERVLVDVSPYSFGPSHLGERGGVLYPHCYRPVIRRNTPLPVTRTELYFTSMPWQERVDLQIYQGDDPDALRNVLVGGFSFDQLTPSPTPSEVLCRMNLDLDGILRVSAIEKRTGRAAHVTIADAMRTHSPEEIAAARQRLEELYARRAVGDDFADAEDAWQGDAADDDFDDDDGEGEGEGAAPSEPATGAVAAAAAADAERLLERSRALLAGMHDEDKEEAVELHEAIEDALRSGNAAALAEEVGRLRELLFFIEGR